MFEHKFCKFFTIFYLNTQIIMLSIKPRLTNYVAIKRILHGKRFGTFHIGVYHN